MRFLRVGSSEGLQTSWAEQLPSSLFTRHTRAWVPAWWPQRGCVRVCICMCAREHLHTCMSVPGTEGVGGEFPPPPTSWGLQAVLRKQRLPCFHHKVCRQVKSRLQTNYRKNAGKGVIGTLGARAWEPEGCQTPLWGCEALRLERGEAQMRWLGKHVSNDTSSVCLSFWLPGATGPQIQCWLAKNTRLQGYVVHLKK